jgi:hypothetical protein
MFPSITSSGLPRQIVVATQAIFRVVFSGRRKPLPLPLVDLHQSVKIASLSYCKRQPLPL